MACVIAGTFGLKWWKERTQSRLLQLRFQTARSAFEKGQWNDALHIIDFTRTDEKEPGWNAWRALELETCVASLRPSRLERLFKQFPLEVAKNESAILALGRIPAIRASEAWKTASQTWMQQMEQVHRWVFLQSDILVEQGLVDEAIELLKSKSFEGTIDIGRLNRLALLSNQGGSLLESWQWLNESVQKDSTQPETRLFRAQLLEQTGRPESARIEYVAAFAASENNPYLCNQLASFYLRQGKTRYAVQTWLDHHQTQSNPFFLWKSWAWTRLVLGPWKSTDTSSPDSESISPFLKESLALEQGVFWNEALEELAIQQGLPSSVEYEAQWLKTVQTIQGLDEEAIQTELIQLLNQVQPKDKLLLTSLLRINKARMHGHYFQPNVPNLLKEISPERTHGFLLVLESAAQAAQTSNDTPDASLENYLSVVSSPLGYMAAFLANGWLESAVVLFESSQAQNPLPDWVAFGLSKAIFLNRGSEAAIAFLDTQPEGPALELVRAEMLNHEGRTDEAEAILKKLLAGAQTENGVIQRAAWMLATRYLDEDRHAELKDILNQNRSELGETRTKELEAKSEIAQGNPKQASAIYTTIQQSSPEAKTFLAQEAFAEQQWDRARQLTEELLEMFPNQLELYANLQRINEAEQGAPASEPRNP